ncbi:hypothetical protein CXF64_20510 [Pseudoalteromonas sp. GutCa3]|nr:hypothetical protein CXF75_14585 [Pseudoalteromonas arctica]PKG68579.1 hypothetical protein CXF64_19855 [Pseudoalteromonas sp. GutCa3]PKG68706.1 hypothetical protein CXF64_20510 [Pseudoalteromonas sp. GutCa3]
MVKNKKHFENVLLFVCFLYFIYLIGIGIKSGCVNPKGGEEYCLVSSPNMYYFILAVYTALIVASVYKIFINLRRKK